MAGLLDGIDQRTRLAGQNRLELLLFHLQECQQFGINVFKVKEVVECPTLTALPGASPVVAGVAGLRGTNILVVDLSHAIGGPRVEQPDSHIVIITEYNCQVLGFLVNSVDRIININWEDMLPPPAGLGLGSYMTAVTDYEGELIEVIDVEKVLSEVMGVAAEVTQPIERNGNEYKGKKVLVVDDSVVARKQVQQVLDQIGIESEFAKDGRDGLNKLQQWSQQGRVDDWLAMVISDIEMPRMDGYALVSEIRNNEGLKNLHVIMHSSLSGVFNEAMVKQVGANNFLAKFDSNQLAGMVVDRCRAMA
jgi:two-component system chemotaxis response regulator CheV